MKRWRQCAAFFKKTKHRWQQKFKGLTGIRHVSDKPSDNDYPSDHPPALHTLKKRIRGSLIFIFSTILLGIAIFTLWSLLAPLDSAVAAQGQVIVGGHKKIVQHADGGIIDTMLVDDGDRVKKDQILLRLDRTKADSELKMVEGELETLQIIVQRLLAEDKKQPLDLSNFDQSKPHIATTINTQNKLLNSKQLAHDTQNQILQKRVAQYQAHLNALQDKDRSLTVQLAILTEKLVAFEQLLAQSFVSRHEMLSIKFEHEQTKSTHNSIQGEIEETQAKLLEVNHEIEQLDVNRDKEIATEYQQIHSRILELEQRQYALLAVLSRTEVHAPVDGIVTDLQYHTLGGVIPPGQKILDIVPEDQPFIIEAWVSSKDIKRIELQDTVKVQLEAYKARKVPQLLATVTYISADKFDSEMGAHYKIHVALAADELSRLNTPVVLQAGIPVSLFIVKGKRTLLEYWFDPLKDSFYKAMKEE